MTKWLLSFYCFFFVLHEVLRKSLQNYIPYNKMTWITYFISDSTVRPKTNLTDILPRFICLLLVETNASNCGLLQIIANIISDDACVVTEIFQFSITSLVTCTDRDCQCALNTPFQYTVYTQVNCCNGFWLFNERCFIPASSLRARLQVVSTDV